MFELIKNLITSSTFLTIISGVFVFVLSQLFNEYYLKPIHEYKKLRAKISYSLILYANLYINPVETKNITEDVKVASYEMRKLAAEVNSMIEIRPSICPNIPKKSVLYDVSKNLIGISNGFCFKDKCNPGRDNKVLRDEIQSLLKMRK